MPKSGFSRAFDARGAAAFGSAHRSYGSLSQPAHLFDPAKTFILVSDHVKVNKSEQMSTLPFFQIRITMPAADEGSSVEPSCGTIHRELRVV